MKIVTVLGCVTAAVLSFGISAAEESVNPTRTETILAEAEGKPELVELLFVQQADRAILKDGILTLEGPSAGFGDHAALFINAFGIGKPGDPGGLRGAKRGKPGDPGGLRGGEPGKPGKPGDPGGLRGAEPGVQGRIGRDDARKFQKGGALDRML